VGEVHLFVLWSEARHAEAEILEDIAHHFRVLDLAEVTWSPEAFAQNLRCLYGTALPPDSPKERHSGNGPFLVVVVEDERPRRRIRRLGRHWRWRRVNARVFDARRRYRAMTGGGYRVHASENEREADRDLVLLFGRRAGEFLAGAAPEGTRAHAADIVGAHGWPDTRQLLLALDVTSGQRVLDPPDGVDLAIEVQDLWWASHVLGAGDGAATRHDVIVDGRPTRVLLVERR
jgi:hypothetical protein